MNPKREEQKRGLVQRRRCRKARNGYERAWQWIVWRVWIHFHIVGTYTQQRWGENEDEVGLSEYDSRRPADSLAPISPPLSKTVPSKSDQHMPRPTNGSDLKIDCSLSIIPEWKWKFFLHSSDTTVFWLLPDKRDLYSGLTSIHRHLIAQLNPEICAHTYFLG